MKLLFPILLLCFLSYENLSAAAVDFPIENTLMCNRTADSLALVAFYTAGNGGTWVNNWDLSQPMDTWHGITLNADGCVVEISLSSNGISGAFAPEMGQLNNLERMTFFNNPMTSSIPTTFGDLTNLQELKLYRCNLVGSIPTELGQLNNLQQLWLHENDLTNAIPAVIGQLTTLQDLRLYQNQLTGSIPSTFGDLINLPDLKLHENQLTGAIPPELGQLTNIQELVLYDNQLTGAIPPELGQLTNLDRLSLYNNQLSSTIPAEIGQLTGLTYLLLSDNNLSGQLPPELGQLTTTFILQFQNNQLSGCFPMELSSFCGKLYDFSGNPNLPGAGDFAAFCSSGTGECPVSCRQNDSLALVAVFNATGGPSWTTTWDLSQAMDTWHGVTLNPMGCVTCLDLDSSSSSSNTGNNLIGNIPLELGQLASLEQLHMQSNQLTGTIPVELGQLSNLSILDLGLNDLTGTIPVELGQLSNLSVLDLASNGLTGNIPIELGQLSNLTSLILGGNMLTGNIPTELGQLSNLEYLNLAVNNLSGTIPSVLGQLTSLIEFIVSNNSLTGTIPNTFGQLIDLDRLHFNDNQISGSVPSSLGQLSSLRYLFGHNNQLTGALPPELGQLTSILQIILNDNQLIGPIPPELGQLSTIKIFQLHNNQIYGIIPSTFGQLSSVQILYLNNNQLSGPIPPELGQLNTLFALSLHNNELSGQLPDALSNLAGITSLYLNDNQLVGCFPPSYSSLCGVFLATFGNNVGLPGNGDFDAFCNNSIGVCGPTGNNVWPGDANYDGMANFQDVVTIGLKHSRTGVTRPSASNTWSSQACNNWNDLDPDGVDAKHADCDGNGTVNIMIDGLIVFNNYNNTHAFNRPEARPPNSNLTLNPVKTNCTTVAGVTTVTIRLDLEENLGENIDFYGTGFVMDYVGNGQSATLDGSNSFLGTENVQKYTFSKDFAGNRIEMACTKMDGFNNNITAYQTVTLGNVLINSTDPNICNLDVTNLNFHSFYTVDNELNEIDLSPMALPLSLVTFKATPLLDEIALNWTTQTEQDVKGFDIQRSENGRDFETIGWTTALGKPNTPMQYTFNDKQVQVNTPYYYRLKIVDNSGAVDYSNIVEARLASEAGTVQLIPNPSTDESWLVFEKIPAPSTKIELYNAFGKHLRTYAPSSPRIALDISDLANGLYFVKILEEQEKNTIKLIKQ